LQLILLILLKFITPPFLGIHPESEFD
jgi:hypothetical protein